MCGAHRALYVRYIMYMELTIIIIILPAIELN